MPVLADSDFWEFWLNGGIQGFRRNRNASLPEAHEKSFALVGCALVVLFLHFESFISGSLHPLWRKIWFLGTCGPFDKLASLTYTRTVRRKEFTAKATEMAKFDALSFCFRCSFYLGAIISFIDYSVSKKFRVTFTGVWCSTSDYHLHCPFVHLCVQPLSTSYFLVTPFSHAYIPRAIQRTNPKPQYSGQKSTSNSEVLALRDKTAESPGCR